MSHCQHFGLCGGCAFTDGGGPDKAAMVPGAVGVVATPVGRRRRVDWGAVRQGPAVLLGLHQARSRTVVDVRECAVLLPEIVALAAPVREVLRRMEGFLRAGSVVVNGLDGGADVLVRVDGKVTAPDRAKLVALARDNGVVRISVAEGEGAPEAVAILAPPVITMSGIAAEPAAGAFLQASREAEEAIMAAVVAGLPAMKAKARIVELYAGVGTISFALRAYGRVEAYEGNAAAVAAQDAAIRKHNLAGVMRVTQRDLSRRPLKAEEMAGAAAVVLDPPYAGAGAQMKNVAASGVKRVIYVSCNPAALAGDARWLRQAGYEAVSAVAIDQFPYSDNVEAVVVFSKL